MEVDEVFSSDDNNHNNKNPPPRSTAQDASTTATSWHNNTDTIQSDLQHVEETLARGPGRGRAAFDSVTSTLRSLRQRLTGSLHNNTSNSNSDPSNNITSGGSPTVPTPETTSHVTQSMPPAAAAASVLQDDTTNDGSEHSRPATETQLIRRLERAELAHSSGIPLPMLQDEMQRRQAAEQQAAVSQKTDSTGNDDDNDENKEGNNNHLQEDQDSPSRRRRASSLVASRQSVRSLRQSAMETELHDAGNDVVLPRILDTDRHEEEDEEEDEEGMKNDHNLWTESSETPDETLEDVQPASVLYSWGVPKQNNSNSSSISEETCPQSLHDDEQVRTLTTARVDATGRLGRYTVVGLHTGPKHSAVVTATGEVLASGSNDSGQVDPYRREDAYILKPTLIESLNMARIRQVSCGRSHTAALVAGTGQVLTWGSNAVGQLGRGPTPAGEPTTFCRPAAMILGPGVRASTIACGHDFTTVLTTRMRLLVCGSRDVVSWDESVRPPRPRYPSSLAVLEGLPLIQVAAGARHVAVVTQGGMVYAWGHNGAHGCCGRESPESIHVPVCMLLPDTKRSLPSPSVDALQRHDYSRPEKIQRQHQSASMVHWNSWDGPNARVSLPDDVKIIHASCGASQTILITQSGSARVFGLPRVERMIVDTDDDDRSHSSKDVFQAKCLDPPEGRSFIDAAAGDSYSLLLDDMGDVWCLRGDFETARLECVLKGQKIVALTAGGRHAAALARGASIPSIPLQREFSGTSDESAVLVRDPSFLVTAVSTLVPLSKEDDGARSRLVVGTEELFKSPAIWNSLFYNPDDCRDLYAKLLPEGVEDSTSSLRQDIATAMERSMLKGLDLLRSDNVRMIYPESVRVLWFYLQNPLFRNWRTSNVKFDYRGDVILALCDAMLSLPFEGYKALMSWATLQYNRAMFREYLVQPLIAQFERGLLDSAGARFRAVPGIVAVLRWLLHAAEQSGIASPEDFYSEALAAMDPQLLYEDLRRYKATPPEAKKSAFFICANPFLLSPTAKRNLLQVEHQVDMIRAATSNVTWDAERRQYVFDPYFVLAIDREHILQQTLQKISSASPIELRKSLRVVFKGEDGVDAGGVTKEFFQLLSQELFDISTGMWSNRFGDRITWFNGDCTWNFDGYYLVGVLVGLALYNSVLIDVPFPKVVYRKLLGRSLGIEDMVDEEIKNGLQALLDYDGDDVEDIFCLNFEVTWTSLGMEKRVELKPGGSQIPVTSSNKEEYALLYVKWLLVDSIRQQWETFEKGVMHVLDGSSLDLLEPDELERLVVGSTNLDFEALRQNTVYEGGYDADSPVVQNFWKFCREADKDSQLRLLKFATGSPKAPVGGLAALGFKIQRAGPDSLQLPTSHTCFNTLLLPDYGDDYEKLSRLVSRAILECEGFGLQ